MGPLLSSSSILTSQAAKMVVLEYSSRDPMSLSDTFSVFLDDDGETGQWSGSSLDESIDVGSDEECRNAGAAEESKAFWEAQHQLLQESLNRNSSIERRVRTKMEEPLRRSTEEYACRCPDSPVKESCRKCALRSVTDLLRDAGYNSALCRSKWRRSPDTPSGEHQYVDVVVDPKGPGNKRNPVRVVIELSFREEFEMARANERYNGLVRCLPEVFVGKAEKLKSVVKIMCSAAKRCMKENGMHIAPWRKHKYMQSKWFAACSERMSVAPELQAAMVSHRQLKMRASMLTIDLHRTDVEVVCAN